MINNAAAKTFIYMNLSVYKKHKQKIDSAAFCGIPYIILDTWSQQQQFAPPISNYDDRQSKYTKILVQFG